MLFPRCRFCREADPAQNSSRGIARVTLGPVKRRWGISRSRHTERWNFQATFETYR